MLTVINWHPETPAVAMRFIMSACFGLLIGACSSAKSTPPTISSFTASPSTISLGGSATLSWSTSDARSIGISPGSTILKNSNGSIKVSPITTTIYTLTANGASSLVTSNVTVNVALAFASVTCPGGTQGSPYAGCALTASGGTPPYSFSVSAGGNYPLLPEGMTLNASTGQISSALIGGQGTYSPQFTVTDSAGAIANQQISFAINGSNAFMAEIFPPDSIFHHRVDAATTSLPVDTSPAAPILPDYQPAVIHPLFGPQYNFFPNGIPAITVPYNQALVAVSTSQYQSYFTSGPIPAFAPVQGTAVSKDDRHVLVYRQAGGGQPPVLYEMWQGVYQGSSWTDSSNALWSDVTSNTLTPLGKGTANAAGLPEAPLLLNADEVIGSGTPQSPNGTVRHPTFFTVHFMLNNYVWPATASASELGTNPAYGCSNGSTAIPAYTELSQSAPPTGCKWSGPAGEIYRLKASVSTPACAATSPQAAIIITGLRNYGIILGDNGMPNGGLGGTPDARWSDSDLSCLFSLTLADFEPVNVSSLMVSPVSAATSH